MCEDNVWDEQKKKKEKQKLTSDMLVVVEVEEHQDSTAAATEAADNYPLHFADTWYLLLWWSTKVVQRQQYRQQCRSQALAMCRYKPG